MYNLLITDVDGVLTTGRFFYSASGKEFKEFGPHDHDGLKILGGLGVQVVAVTADARGFEITKARCDDMGVKVELVSGQNRRAWCCDFAQSQPFGFVGDAFSDISSMRAAVRSYCPISAPAVVRENADVVLDVEGGNGVMLAIAEDWIKSFSPNKLTGYRIGEMNDSNN